MDLPSEKQPSSPATGRSPARETPYAEGGAAAQDEDIDLEIGEDIFRRPVESIPQGPPPRGRDKQRLNNDLNPPPTEVKEVEPRKKKKNPLEKRNAAPLDFKRVVRPQTALAASAAASQARAESPVALDAVNQGTMEFGKVHDSAASPDYRPNKLHSVLDSAYKHSRLRWLDWMDRVGLPAILGVLFLLIGGGFFAWRYFGSISNEQSGNTSSDGAPKGISASDRVARGKLTVEQFIQAQTNEARLPLVMDPERTRERMTQFYGAMGGQNPNIVSWDVGAPIGSKNGDWLPFTFTDTAGRKVTVALGETATGCILDWENFVAYSDISWQEFCHTRSDSPRPLRVRLRRADRYGGPYTQEAWQSYEVEHRSGGPKLIAFANRSARDARDLEELVKGDQAQCALVFLRFNPSDGPDGPAVIESLARTRWQDEATSWTGP